MGSLSATCPYCGEPVELSLDESGGDRQAYVEDCPVCCQPWHVQVSRNHEDSWSATVRTADE